MQANLTSSRDATLKVIVQVTSQGGNGTLVITLGGATVCSTTATVGNTVTATCGKVAVTMTIAQRQDGSLTGTLQTSGGGA